MDVLSDVLRAVRLTGALFFDVHAGNELVAETPLSALIAGSVMPDAEHVISFHIMLEGSCWAELTQVEGQDPIRLNAGDIIIFPRGDAHVFCSVPGMRNAPDLKMYKPPKQSPLPIILEGRGEGQPHDVRFICGYLGCDATPYNPLLEALPRIIHSGKHENGGHLEIDLIQLAVEESKDQRAGGETVLAKLSELLFIRAIRRYIDNLDEDAEGWLSALRDKHVSEALTLIHQAPSKDWTLDSLAKEVGVSRSSFSERFTKLTGISPIKYLAQWRMQLAARLLEKPEITVARAASEVGYQSEAAFNRAFKKYVGTPPGEWRRAHVVTDA